MNVSKLWQHEDCEVFLSIATLDDILCRVISCLKDVYVMYKRQNVAVGLIKIKRNNPSYMKICVDKKWHCHKQTFCWPASVVNRIHLWAFPKCHASLNDFPAFCVILWNIPFRRTLDTFYAAWTLLRRLVIMHVSLKYLWYALILFFIVKAVCHRLTYPAHNEEA